MILTGDANAVARGKVPQRLVNRFMGRTIANLMRGRWLR